MCRKDSVYRRKDGKRSRKNSLETKQGLSTVPGDTGKHWASQVERGTNHFMGPPTGGVAPKHRIITDRQHLGYRSLKSYCPQMRVRTTLGKRGKGRIGQAGGHRKEPPSFLLLFQGQKLKPGSWLFLLTGDDTAHNRPRSQQSNHSSFKLKQRMRQFPGNLDF